MPWNQNYAALNGSLLLTALVVAIPIFFLFWALAVKRMKGHVAGLITLLLTIIISVAVYRMPISAALSASALGMVTGLFPIGWIILTAVFLFNLTVESGQFEIIKSSISSLSPDRRIQALLIAFSFSAFMEGVAGQGAPVAVAAAMLIGLGFPPLPAAVICLVANTPPVPFGPVGVPTMMMSTVTGIPATTMARAVGIDMAFMALIIPFFMLVVMVGFKRAKEVIPAALVAGTSYGATSLVISTYFGPELPAITASVVSLLCLVIFIRFWQPKTTWTFEEDKAASQTASTTSYSAGQIFKAWSPFLILMVVMGIWGTPAFKNYAEKTHHWFLAVPKWPGLDGVVFKAAPIVAKPAAYAASYKWQWLTAPGTAMFLSSLISMVVLGIGPATGGRVFLKTFKQLRFALVTLSAVIGLGFLANYSGMSFTLGLTFAALTGMAFPIFSPVIGLIGVFLTGSVTSSAALFGKLQQVTAIQLGMNPVLTTSANLFGGVMGKLISPQSIAVACAAVGLVGKETDIFRKTLKYSLILLGIVIVVVLLQAFVIPWILPVAPVAS
ncbi:MAG: lactate permease LctP family transporter [Geothrix sp.]|uniref:L-lactate permease n=1 Tax=Geothrix sp. TaxID=1962974 RepID=UPI0017F4CB5D|nr:lactate permease LctP family transporter [Geothrix sp.]NWJ41219.1 lactate permease LctP family transporter [Geothrix sp.]WIL20790.1 MAG: lactate permease LctP family transporter [Geothrix sp.]